MFQSEQLNQLFRTTQTQENCSQPYAMLSSMAASHHSYKHGNVVYCILASALETLEDDHPITVIEMESVIEDFVQGLVDKHDKFCFEAKMAQIGLRDREHDFARVSGIDESRESLNFSLYDDYVTELVRSKARPQLVEAMQEVAVANKVIKELKRDVAAMSEQLEAYSSWRDSAEYSDFTAAYAAVRKETVRANRHVAKQEKFAL